MILAIVLSITTFPQIAIAAPLFKLWSDIGLFNTLLGLIIPYLTFALPLSIYILVSFFRRSRGTSRRRRWSTARRTSRRSARSWSRWPHPAWRPPAILTFIAAWNEFLLAVTLTSLAEGPHGAGGDRVLHRLDGVRGPAGTISAASVVISIPLILLVLLFQKRIVAGLTAGAVKG